MEKNKKIKKADQYKLFSECFYYPDEEQFSVIKSYSELFPEILEKFSLENESLEFLQVEYSRLFLGPFELLSAPYGSVYLEEGNKLLGDSTMDVVQLYQKENLNVDIKEVPDHIAIELEFMSYLIIKEVEAINKENNKLANEYYQKQIHFFKKHLSTWAKDFTKSVLENSKSDFYKGISVLLNETIDNELNYYKIDKL